MYNFSKRQNFLIFYNKNIPLKKTRKKPVFHGLFFIVLQFYLQFCPVLRGIATSLQRQTDQPNHRVIFINQTNQNAPAQRIINRLHRDNGKDRHDKTN